MLIVLGFRTVVQPLIGLMLLGWALALRPRPGRLDPDLPILREADAPTLFELLHRTADSAGARRIDAIQFTADFSVSVIHYGLRHKRCFVVGLPLWAAYLPQQRIGAMAQALGQSAPRNVRCGVFIGLALRSLTAGSQAMRAGNASATESSVNPHTWYAGDVAGAARRFNARARKSEWVLWILRTAMAAMARLLLWLTRPAARRARFEADDAAARAASSQATLAALRDRHLARAMSLEMHRLFIEKRTLVKAHTPAVAQDDLWENVAQHAARLREQRDIAQSSELDSRGGVFGSTCHDSDALRMARLVHAPQCPATITLDGPCRARIEDELRLSKQAVAQLVLRDGIPLSLNLSGIL
ncbi:M48 family metallopeptidase [Streptomyces sp. NPDC005146]